MFVMALMWQTAAAAQPVAPVTQLCNPSKIAQLLIIKSPAK
jgi:hypothetical protein